MPRRSNGETWSRSRLRKEASPRRTPRRRGRPSARRSVDGRGAPRTRRTARGAPSFNVNGKISQRARMSSRNGWPSHRGRRRRVRPIAASRELTARRVRRAQRSSSSHQRSFAGDGVLAVPSLRLSRSEARRAHRRTRRRTGSFPRRRRRTARRTGCDRWWDTWEIRSERTSAPVAGGPGAGRVAVRPYVDGVSESQKMLSTSVTRGAFSLCDARANETPRGRDGGFERARTEENPDSGLGGIPVASHVHAAAVVAVRSRAVRARVEGCLLNGDETDARFSRRRRFSARSATK